MENIIEGIQKKVKCLVYLLNSLKKSALFLNIPYQEEEEEGIVSQYTIPGTPQQNGVIEKSNHTLMDIVRSMINSSNLSLSL